MRRIKQIAVKGLFGTFDHVIPLNMEDRITIIHGLNGVGKTTILNLLNELFSQRIAELLKVPFHEFRVDFDDSTALLVISSINTSKKINPALSIPIFRIKTLIKGHEIHSYTLDASKIIQTFDAKKNTRRLQLSLDALQETLWEQEPQTDDPNTDISEEDIEKLLNNRIFASIYTENQPDWLSKLRESISVRFLATQRLLTLTRSGNTYESGRRTASNSKMEPAVQTYATELAAEIKMKITESATLSQALDKTFPQRVFEPNLEQHNITERELRSKLAEQEKKRSRLITAGLLDQDNSASFQMGEQIDDGQKIMLAVYVEDMNKKLGVFDEISQKLNLLTGIINKRFLYKKMTINKEAGFVFTTEDDKNIPLDKLSSGEQNELVLFYNLLFKTKPGSLILIDEPELSLHVAWQIEFLEDLQDIISLTDIDMIITTHSPQIIHDRWDLTVTLEGPHR